MGNIHCVVSNNWLISQKMWQKHPGLRFVSKLNTYNDKQKLSLAAVELAESLDALCIVVITVLCKATFTPSLTSVRPEEQ